MFLAKNLQQILNQISKLESQAKALRDAEKVGVVARIREAIAHYEITPDELFGTETKVQRKKRGPAKQAKARKPASVAKYSDGGERTWSGVGKRPNWFKEALASGKTAEDLLIKK
jgi:DNA-binding protein H-NS